jgi:ribosomal protein S18 acetylase RimI-like enzyme
MSLQNKGGLPFMVRPYEPADRPEVFRLMADTAFFGEPVEAFLEARELFCDAFCAYYTDLEPERVWVASLDGRAVGALLGCIDSRGQRNRWRRQVLPVVVRRWLKGRYRVGPLTWRYILSQSVALMKGELPAADLKPYPAHLHINVEAGWRGQGLGKRLVTAFLQQIHEMGLPGVHLSTTSLNRSAIGLYKRVGFELLDARVTQAWGHWVKDPVENRLYGMGLERLPPWIQKPSENT